MALNRGQELELIGDRQVAFPVEGGAARSCCRTTTARR